MSANSDNIFSRRSPTTLRNNDNRRPEAHTTRRLSQAIDALRREYDIVLWELNSLKTQNSVLERRILEQVGELEDVNRNLRALQEQHALLERQYREHLRALRSELRALQEGKSSSTVSLSVSTHQPEASPHSPR